MKKNTQSAMMKAFCFSLLVFLSFSGCLNLVEEKGKCSECSGSELLYEGNCYTKQRGCLEYMTPSICMACQSGYVLNEAKCIREAVFYKLESKDIPAMKINIEGQLSAEEVQERVGSSKLKSYEKVNWHFKAKYRDGLEGTSVQNVHFIETYNRIVFTIYYRSVMTIYEAVASINLQGENIEKQSVEELLFLERKKVPKYSLAEIIQGLHKKYPDQLSESVIGAVQVRPEEEYVIDFIDSNWRKLRIGFKVEPYIQVLKLTQVEFKTFEISRLLEFLYEIREDLKKMPYRLTRAPYFDSQSESGIYRVQFGSNLSIGVRFEPQLSDFELIEFTESSEELKAQDGAESQGSILSKDIEFEPEMEQSDETSTEDSELQTFTDLQDPMFLEAWKYLIEHYSIYEEYQIEKVQSSRNSSPQFKIQLKGFKDKKGHESVEVEIHNHHSQKIEIVSISTQGEVVDFEEDHYYDQFSSTQKVMKRPKIKSQSFSYENDQQFQEAYRFLQRTVKIVNEIPISKVLRHQQKDSNDYEIIFSQDQVAKVRYQKVKQGNLRKGTDDSRFEVLYYRVDGVNIFRSSQENSRAELQQKVEKFLKSNQSSIFTNYIVRSFEQSNQVSTIQALTPTGFYQARLSPLFLEFNILSLIQLSNRNCLQLSISSESQNPTSHSEMQKIDEFLRNSYELDGLDLELVEVEITPNTKKYLVLYGNEERKQLEMRVQSFRGNLIVVQSQALEYGYSNTPLDHEAITSAEQLANQHYSQFTRKCETKLGRSNGTHTKLIYSCPHGSFEYVSNTVNGTDRLQAIEKQRNLKQSQVNSSRLVPLTELVSDASFNKIDALVRERFPQYIENSEAISVERFELAAVRGFRMFLYKIYYKYHSGHFVCEASWSEGQIEPIKVVNFYFSGSEQNHMCQLFDEEKGECVNCLEGYQLEFGQCYKRVPNCSLQVGNTCVQCHRKSVIHRGVCKSACGL